MKTSKIEIENEVSQILQNPCYRKSCSQDLSVAPIKVVSSTLKNRQSQKLAI
jgi:hypothetical protein